MNPRAIIQKANNRDGKDDDKRLSLQPRPVNDISSLVKMMSTMVNLNRRVDVNARASSSQFTININRCPDSDHPDDDEGVIYYNYSKIKHFSHLHNLSKHNFQQSSLTNCRICGLQLVGPGYGCQSCQFYLHVSCFNLPRKIQHPAHPAHPLTLHHPSHFKLCGKKCDACRENMERSFVYSCEVCDYDLHVTCTTLYSTVKSVDGSTLRLYYNVPVGARCCNVCHRTVSKEGWLYCNMDDRRVAHINCAKGLNPSSIKERLNLLKIK